MYTIVLHINGCIHSLLINNINVLVTHSDNEGFSVTTVGVASGCHSDNLCMNNDCPANSTCNPLWRKYNCTCNTNYIQRDYQCINPCDSNPCGGKGIGVCSPKKDQTRG